MTDWRAEATRRKVQGMIAAERAEWERMGFNLCAKGVRYVRGDRAGTDGGR